MDPEEIGTGGQVDYDLALAIADGNAPGDQPAWLDAIHDFVYEEIDED